MTMLFLQLALMLVVILAASELFTNALEHLGEKLGISEGVTGSLFAAIGTALGLVLTWFASALIRNLIWGVQPHDALTYIVVTALMFAIAASASVLPALRLIKLDPAETLRDN